MYCPMITFCMPNYRLLRRILFAWGHQPIKDQLSYTIPASYRNYTTEMDVTDIFTDKKGGKSNLRHINYMEKCHGNIPPPSVIETQVLGCGHPGTPRSLLVNLNIFKYLFNCGEGTQRICKEHKMKPAKIQDIFFTRKSWANVGGLVSLCFSLEGMGVPGIRLHGPNDLEKVVTEAKGFTQARNLKLQIVKLDVTQHTFEDSAMHVHYIPMKLKENTTEEPVSKKLKLTDNSDSFCVAYLCQPKPKTRNVDLEKCVELGVSKGVMIGQLTKGLSVTLENGKVVHPEDILAPPSPNPPFLVLECPSVGHLISLQEHPKIQEFHNSNIMDACPSVIFHLTSDEILAHPKYQAWMQEFPESTKHVIMNESCCGLVYEGVYKIQTMLNMVHSGIFPLLPDVIEPKIIEEKITTNSIIRGRTNMKIVIRGKNAGSVIKDDCITLKPEEYRDAVLKDEACGKAFTASTQSKADQDNKESNPYPEVLFLGTGSAEPNKVRNVSGIWINISSDSCLLLDCGENTLGQFLRHYGNKADDLIVKLKAIFISHLHADHHLGVTDVVLYRRKVLESRGLEISPVPVIGTRPLDAWNEFLSSMFPEVAGLVRIIPIFIFNKNFEGNKPAEFGELHDLLSMTCIESVRVRHGGMPFGMVLCHKDGWKLVYSGDTMPAYGLVTAGKDCDILIHEATMEDDMADEAEAKKHSTTSQAINIGLDMNAKFILLTHFSQRYPKIPLFNDNFSEKVGIAFDNMRVCLSELHVLPTLKEKLKALFAEDISALEIETIKRTVSKNRNKNSKKSIAKSQRAKDKEPNV